MGRENGKFEEDIPIKLLSSSKSICCQCTKSVKIGMILCIFLFIAFLITTISLIIAAHVARSNGIAVKYHINPEQYPHIDERGYTVKKILMKFSDFQVLYNFS